MADTTMNTKPTFPAKIVTSLATITETNGTSLVTLFSAGSDGSFCDKLLFGTSKGDSDLNVQLIIANETNSEEAYLGRVTVPAQAGIIPTVPTFNALEALGFTRLNLAAGYKIQMHIDVATPLSTGQNATVFASGGDF